MNITKEQLWPKKGKAKKILIIIGIIIFGALLITLIEERTNVKISRRASIAIALICISTWCYEAKKNDEQANRQSILNDERK